ncbi:hypothetical protein Psi02_27180 [Planotetraspora silvatica]|uniref:Uncharacterized protein n=1 Tax=Planotetraspora silvatica TaxID=234614 RepID=A0A8J3XM81_9ACTN|nr:hypothetical protein [Planotetraspora silvatica]GII46294.1 hypothetical protein Psi02_27180 [Planotetraspora silvatica]
MDTYVHLFPDDDDLGRGALEAMVTAALTEQQRNNTVRRPARRSLRFDDIGNFSVPHDDPYAIRTMR